MKKILTLILILAMILSLSSCNRSDADEQKEPPDSQYGSSERALFSIHNYDDYLKFLEERKDELPDHFIKFEEDSPFGKLDGIVIWGMSSWLPCEYESYMYSFVVEKEKTIDGGAALYVYHGGYSSSETKPENIVSNIEGDSLLECGGDVSKVYFHNGVKYSYCNGDLDKVQWTSNGTTFIYCRFTEKGFNDPDIVLDSEITEKLFTKSGAAEAVRLFDEMINEAK